MMSSAARWISGQSVATPSSTTVTRYSRWSAAVTVASTQMSVIVPVKVITASDVPSPVLNVSPVVPFKVMVPTVIEKTSWIDREKPVRMYRIDPDRKHKTVRLTYKLGSGTNEYWGVQMTDWEDAPALSERNFVRSIGGRTYELHYTGPKLHMVVLRQGGASYWVVNTLLDSLSNETMLAIARGLRPLPR